MSVEKAYIKAEGYHVSVNGTGEELLALLSGVISNFKYGCDMSEELIQMAVDFGLKHDARNMDEDEDYKEFKKEKEAKDELKSKIEEIIKILEK